MNSNIYPIAARILERRESFIRSTHKEPLRLYIGAKREYELRKEITPDHPLYIEYWLGRNQAFGMTVYLVCNDDDHLEVV